MTHRVGILGGTFDPPHLSHLAMARIVFDAGLVDTVLMVPCFRHAFGKEPASFENRLEMCREMTRGIEFINVSDAERELATPGRTLALVELLQKKDVSSSFRLIVGGDIYRERHKCDRAKKRLAPRASRDEFVGY